MMRFAHLANPLPKHLKVGEEVRAGDWLGNVGNTGGRYAIHLHFEFRLKKGNYNVPVNPFNNKIHTFCKADFESSTQKAYTSRKNIQAGMSLAETHAKMDRENTCHLQYQTIYRRRFSHSRPRRFLLSRSFWS